MPLNIGATEDYWR